MAVTRANMQNSLAYTWNAVSQTVLVTVFVFIFSQLWQTTFAAQDADVINGLTLNMTIWYYVWAELVQLSKINPISTMQNEVKDGSLAYTLGRPYNYVLYHFFMGLGGVAIRMVSVLVLGSLTALLVAGPLQSFRPLTVPLLLVVTLLAIILDYCMVAFIGLLAFFFEDVAAFRLIYSKIIFILGGLMIPVDFLPGNVQTVARVLPFNLVVYAPAKLFVKWETSQFMQVIALQVFWIGVMAAIVALTYRHGARRVSINGG